MAYARVTKESEKLHKLLSKMNRKYGMRYTLSVLSHFGGRVVELLTQTDGFDESDVQESMQAGFDGGRTTVRKHIDKKKNRTIH